MTRNEFIQQCAISMRSNGCGHVEAWTDATQLADAAPKGTFDVAQAARPASSGATGAVFPNFGKAKGTPIAGAAQNELRYYAGAAVRSIEDASKARYLDSNKAQLASYIAEMERQGFDASEFKRHANTTTMSQAGDPPEPTERQSAPQDDPNDIPF